MAGSSRCSTLAKNASMSTWTILRACMSGGAARLAVEALEDGEREPGVVRAPVRLRGYQHAFDGSCPPQLEGAGTHAATVRVRPHGALEGGQGMRDAPGAARLHAEPLVERS